MTKNNEKIWRWARIVIPIIILLLGAVYAYGQLNKRVDTLETQAVEAKETKERVIRIEAHVENIKEAVGRIEEKIDK